MLSAQRPTFSAEQLQKFPALAHTVRSRAWTVFPVLKQNSMGACAALTDGGLACWGRHDSYRFGIGSTGGQFIQAERMLLVEGSP